MFTDAAYKIESVPVPMAFRMPDTHHYPKGNFPDFELWFSQNVLHSEIKTDRIYLGVLWTSYYKINCNYGNDKEAIHQLQLFLNSLDTTKKYFGIIQYDDGILNDISHLDIKVFSMAGKPMDYCLPLVCQQHGRIESETRDIFASFVGRDTHPLRKEIFKLSGKPKYYISNGNHGMKEYCKILSRSVFGICPRGFSATSFRIVECIEQGAIPIYCSDSFLEPHGIDFNTYGVEIHSDDIDRIDEILHSIPDEEIKIKQSLLKGIFDNFYTFQSCKRIILENL